MTPQTVLYLRDEGSELKLDIKHNYYAQVHGQLFIMERKVYHFVVPHI